VRSARDSLSNRRYVDAKLAFRILCSSHMKKGDVSARKVACRALFALGCFAFIQLVGVRSAQAESARKVEGFELLGSLGYGVAVGLWAAGERELDPYGVTPGLDFGHTWPFGLRIGTDVGYGFGRRLEYTSRTGEVIATHASSFTWGASFGYDFFLSSFTLRGAVDGGLAVRFDEGDADPLFYVGPKVAFIWQYRAFEFGFQTKYLWGVPSAFQVGLMGGTRF
jgi:hypothetical protein